MPCKSEKHIPDFSSERAPHMNIPETVWKIIKERMGKIRLWSRDGWLTSRRTGRMTLSHYNFGFALRRGTSGSVVGSVIILQAGRSRVRFPMRSLDLQLT
jgi:hypothetical protein